MIRSLGIVLLGVSLFIIWRVGYALPVVCTLLIAQAYLVGLTAKRRPA